MTMNTAVEVYPLVSIIYDAMAAKQYEMVDSWLENAPLEKMTNLAMMATIRTTYSMQRHLTQWVNTRDRIAVELISRGEDHHQIMKGLFDRKTPNTRNTHKIIGL